MKRRGQGISKRLRPLLAHLCTLLSATLLVANAGAEEKISFSTVKPILSNYCFDCHADGANKGNIAFDEFKSDAEMLQQHDLWLKALKNVRAGTMPPPKKDQPTDAEKQLLEKWIKQSVFEVDPANPDPGKVTVRRLNRVEYRNTIRDLVGVDFDTGQAFPPDDTGHGFDNIGDVLTISPLLLEKYLDAAKAIISQVVPTSPRVVAERVIPGAQFSTNDVAPSTEATGALNLSYYTAAKATGTVTIESPGDYQAVIDLVSSERYVDNVFDYNRCELTIRIDGEETLKREFVREGRKPFQFVYNRKWDAGTHSFEFEVRPLTPDEKQIRSLNLGVTSVTVRGPLDQKHWVRPKGYEKIFPKETPTDVAGKRAYARELIEPFATKAFRRPVDAQTLERLVNLAESVYTQPKLSFEAGVAQAMIATLASPRFLFREEETLPEQTGRTHPQLDEYSLASRLSYFLWSSMPDSELFALASRGELRKNQRAQVNRMLRDPKAVALIENFSGQWLQTRDIEKVQINARAVLARDDGAGQQNRQRGFGFRRPRADLTPEIRAAMREETERYFEHILKENRSVSQLIDSDFTFLNEDLAKHYGLTNLNVTGREMQLVNLPRESGRGGVLTHGSVLAVTSNPTRTSPVKRGLFILENILGTPPPPAPPDIPALEDAEKKFTDREPTLRETLELHRGSPVCSSCHNRMDPFGLAFENFNALGMWREKENNLPVDVAGKLLTGEEFKNVQELKTILANDRRHEFYHTLTEKFLTYALGRSLEYYDVETVDAIVAKLDADDGKFSTLLFGVIESAPFQKQRSSGSGARVSND